MAFFSLLSGALTDNFALEQFLDERGEAHVLTQVALHEANDTIRGMFESASRNVDVKVCRNNRALCLSLFES